LLLLQAAAQHLGCLLLPACAAAGYATDAVACAAADSAVMLLLFLTKMHVHSRTAYLLSSQQPTSPPSKIIPLQEDAMDCGM
jgi:hypothetical protein